MELSERVLSHEDAPAVAFMKAISLARDTDGGYDDAADEIKRFLELYPHEAALHRAIMIWKLERWGGARGAGPAYAAAVANAVGPPMGDFIYSRCIGAIQGVFPHAFFNYAQVEGNRVLAGIRHGLEMGYYQEASTLSTMRLLHGSHGRNDAPSTNSPYGRKAVALTEELAAYYKTRYPMLNQATVDGGNFQALYRYLPR